MIDAGAIEEVKGLLARGLDPSLPAMKAVGVREIGAYLMGRATLDQAVEATRQSTRNYAKRQLTWFRNQTPTWTRVAPDRQSARLTRGAGKVTPANSG